LFNRKRHRASAVLVKVCLTRVPLTQTTKCISIAKQPSNSNIPRRTYQPLGLPYIDPPGTIISPTPLLQTSPLPKPTTPRQNLSRNPLPDPHPNAPLPRLHRLRPNVLRNHSLPCGLAQRLSNPPNPPPRNENLRHRPPNRFLPRTSKLGPSNRSTMSALHRNNPL
jgi:hypothetical protein